ncbi:MAG: ABC transporter substrate-binding protein [Alphaproteobacteria bacterium]|nr:ABC transporter substrate-binding protein [Alphaproteobacteria bacterium]
MRKVLISLASAIAVTATFGAAPVSAADSPLDPAVQAIKSFYATLIDTMKRGKELGLEGRAKELKPATESAFDLAEITRLSIGPSWSGISDDQRKALVDAMERVTVFQYAKNFSKFNGEQFVVSPDAKPRSDDKIVESKLVSSDGNSVAFNYRMHPVDGHWKVVDVYLNGNISQLALRRADFSSTVQKFGPTGLVAKLNEMVDKDSSGQ